METAMPIDKPYQDIPGTTLFDADQARKGYWLNQFCMSLMKAENRERFKADERAYLDEWAMTAAQKEAVLARDLNQCIRLGGNIYFLAKIGATDGRSYQQMAAGMTGMSETDYRDMMLAGGRRPDGTPRRAPVAQTVADDASTATKGDTRQDTSHHTKGSPR
jgi:protocatechuate 4,5-dioxygenase, alpha chain